MDHRVKPGGDDGSMPLEILHGALVLFGGGPRLEGSEIAALAGFRIHLSGIEPVFTRLQFSDHGTTLGSTALVFNGDRKRRFLGDGTANGPHAGDQSTAGLEPMK
jgi:hypothetical protein